MDILWEEIKDEKDPLLQDAFDLYDHTFPIEVREPHQVFLESLKYSKTSFPNNFRFLVGTADGELVSFATAHYLAEVNAGFIVYILSNRNVRCTGIGSMTLSKIEALLEIDAKMAGFPLLHSIVLETEKEEVVHTDEEKRDCKKRNRFFEKHYYRLIDNLKYIQPPLHQEVEGVPLNLFVKPMTKDQISPSEIAKIIRSMYVEKYDKVNKINKLLLRACLDRIGGGKS